MNERFQARESEIPEESRAIQIRFGEEIRTFTSQDTVVRRFVQGDGKFDHCVYCDPDGHLRAFTPDERAMEEFERLGFPVRTDETIDETTITHYAKVQAAHLDDERSPLDL